MISPSTIATEHRSTQTRSDGLTAGVLRTGLIGAGALTVTWWALIACGLWRAIEWVGA